MNLVLTIAIGEDYEKIAKLTHDNIRVYADRFGSEFMCIDKQRISYTTPHWEKFQIHDLLDEYDRILYLDTDIIIRDDCPNLFDEVPEDKLGAFNETFFRSVSHRRVKSLAHLYGCRIPKWNGNYYNAGVMVISQQHKPLFKKPLRECEDFYEQSYLNVRIAQLNIPVYELHHSFNYMTGVDSITDDNRHDAFIIHYAGYDRNIILEAISNDIAKWKVSRRLAA